MNVKSMRGRKPLEAGFSLTELMIVIVIIGILLGIVFSNMDVLDKANSQKAEQEISKFKINLESYRADNGAFPPSGALNALVSNPGNAPRWRQYMKSLPKDPWGSDYRYLNPGSHNNEMDVYSIGPDKREGTDDDVGSWRLER
jgi:general secretion pathway protein G